MKAHKYHPHIIKNEFGTFYFDYDSYFSIHEWKNSKFMYHRLDGPAIIRIAGKTQLPLKQFYIFNIEVTERVYWDNPDVKDYLRSKGLTVKDQKTLLSLIEI